MKQLTEKQKKYLWIAAGVLICIHFLLPRFINLIHPNASHAAVGKPPATHYSQVPAPPPPLPPEVIAANKYGGVWENATLMPDADRCTVRLEIRLSDDVPKKLKGYSTVRCIPLQTLVDTTHSLKDAKKAVEANASPASAVLTGAPQPGGLTFTVDSSISSSSDGCAITGFSIVDFGQGQVMANWQEGTCPSRQMLLRKARG